MSCLWWLTIYLLLLRNNWLLYFILYQLWYSAYHNFIKTQRTYNKNLNIPTSKRERTWKYLQICMLKVYVDGCCTMRMCSVWSFCFYLRVIKSIKCHVKILTKGLQSLYTKHKWQSMYNKTANIIYADLQISKSKWNIKQ